MILTGGGATRRWHRTRLTVHCWPFRRFSTRREEGRKRPTPAGLRHILHVKDQASKRLEGSETGRVDYLTGILETLLADGAERARLQRSATRSRAR